MTIPEQKSGVLGFDTALNTKNNPFLPSRNFYKFDGWYLTESLSITKRKGFEPAQITTLNDPITGLWEFRPSVGENVRIATTTDKLYVFNSPVSNEWNEVSLANVGGNRTGGQDDLFDMTTYLDQIYIGNGVDTNIWFDITKAPSTIYQMGITAPSTALVPSQYSTGASGLDAGIYSYKVTYVNHLGRESNPSPVSIDITVDATHTYVSLASIPISSDPQVTSRTIYRTTVDGGLWLYLDTINDNTTTTYLDSLNDLNLGIAIEGFANGVPPKFSMIDLYKGVAFMAGDPTNKSRVWFSSNSKPSCVDSNDFRDLDSNDGDSITGLMKYRTTVVAFKKGSIWNAIGEDRTTFGFDRTVSSVGAVNNACIVDVPVAGVLAFMSPSGRFYFYNGVSATPQAEDLEPTLKGLNMSKLSKVVGTVVPELNQCQWIVPNGGYTYCNMIVWYDYLLNKWGVTSVGVMQLNYCTSMHETDGNKELFVGTVGGMVYQGDSGGADNSAAITCEVMDRGHPSPNDSPETNKVFSHIFVFFKPTTGATLNLYGYKNDPDGTPIFLGTADASKASGQDHIHINMKCRRLYIKIVESSAVSGLVLRGWQVYFKDVRQHNAP